MMRKRLLFPVLFLIILACVIGVSCAAYAEGEFPKSQPDRACFLRPAVDETLDISPPGFCWWRAGTRGDVHYKLIIRDAAGNVAYESPVVDDPAHVPDKVLPSGTYSWSVEARDAAGNIVDTLPARAFTITENAFAQPWISTEKLLARVPSEHPRLLFTAKELNDVRNSLTSTRKEASASIRAQADHALKLTVPTEPDYDKQPTRADQRLAYFESFGMLRRYHEGGMMPMALMYLLTGEQKYGLKAKELLLGAAEWDPEGISSILSPYGDEVGLGLAKSAAHTYDWICDLLTPAEREKVQKMLVARADQMLRRLQKSDYLATPGESHNGRLPGYLVEHAIAMAEHPRAKTWMDYALLALMTCFPHWGGRDGGWAEGVQYGLSYNQIYLVPFESLRHATGFDLWQRPFYRKVRTFFLYNAIPNADIAPFGDTEHQGVSVASLRSFLIFHANLFKDPAMRWYADQIKNADGTLPPISGLTGLILPDEVVPQQPNGLANNAAFYGVGWAALHSDLLHPQNDLVAMFKSSAFGGVSHSHADQNTFAIIKSSKSLAIPAGVRYPHHGSPFHLQYVQQTVAHNAVLIDGMGQVNRDSTYGGKLADFQSTIHVGYVCGDAGGCYNAGVRANKRHVLMIRPSIVLVVDELAADKPVSFQWLLHARNQFQLDEGKQTLISSNPPEAMTVRLYTPGGFSFTQTDQWPVDPKKGYPNAKNPPKNQWHFTAATKEPRERCTIAAVMLVYENGKMPDYKIDARDDAVNVEARSNDGTATARILLDRKPDKPLITCTYSPKSGAEEVIAAQ